MERIHATSLVSAAKPDSAITTSPAVSSFVALARVGAGASSTSSVDTRQTMAPARTFRSTARNVVV